MDHYAAAARSISLVSILTATAPGTVEDVLTEVREESGERGVLALTEAAVILLRLAVDDLDAVLATSGSDRDAHASVIRVYDQYAQDEERALSPLLPGLLDAAGGATLAHAQALTALVAQAGADTALVTGLAKATGMVLRLIEAGTGTPVDELISDFEDRLLIRT
ncbi:hypothetical protein [Streptomyces hydrogenans]|uniref:hypothetical protein n=1 Tax=Streptomyces hydrogenans TaxID=1873719 RepID=UPI003830D0C2